MENAQTNSIVMATLQWKLRSCTFVISWDPTFGRAELKADTRQVATVLRDLGWRKATQVRRPEGRSATFKVQSFFFLGGRGIF